LANTTKGTLLANGGNGGNGANGGVGRGTGRSGGAGGNGGNGGSGGPIGLNVDGAVTLQGVVHAVGGIGGGPGQGGNGVSGATSGSNGSSGGNGGVGSITINTHSASIDTGFASTDINPLADVSLGQDRLCGTQVQEGCGHGFWKNHTSEWENTSYTTSQTVDSVFTVPGTFSFGSETLLDALTFNGPGSTPEAKAQILLLQAVAAILNATDPNINYPRSASSVITDVNAEFVKLANGDTSTWEALKDALEFDNSLGDTDVCPLEVD
jgi:hypothetical protein